MTLKSVRDITASEMVPCVRARVALHQGESTHYLLNDEGYLQVSVVTAQGTEINALLGNHAGDDGSGLWRVPQLGTEVLVAFADGDFEGDAFLVACAPGRMQGLPPGLAVGTTVLQDAHVVVRAVGGVAAALPTLAWAQSLVTFLQGLTLPVSGGTAGPPTPGTVPTVVGTTVLEAQ